MGNRWRPVLGAAAVAIVMCLAVAAGWAQGLQKSPAPQPKPPAPAATPKVAMPEAERIVLLVRIALLSLNDALQTGNYTVLRDLGAPAFRDNNTAARLAQIFSSLAGQRIDLTAVAIMTPTLSETPTLDEGNKLRLKGFFPGQPLQINFEITYEVVAGRWRLFGLAVQPVVATALDAAATAATPPPGKQMTPADKKAEPAKK